MTAQRQLSNIMVVTALRPTELPPRNARNERAQRGRRITLFHTVHDQLLLFLLDRVVVELDMVWGVRREKLASVVRAISL